MWNEAEPGCSERDSPSVAELMETLASRGRFLTLAPFCKSLAPVPNKRREGRCGYSVGVSAHLANICLCSAEAIVGQSFLFRLSTGREAALSASVL